MALYSSIILDGDENRVLAFGAGLMFDVADKCMDAERAEAERTALIKEQTEFEDRLAQERQDVIDTESFWSARHGDRPRTTADVLAEYAAAADRRDRQQARREALSNVTDLDAAPFKSPMQARREAYAVLDKIAAEPATVGDVRKAAGEAHVGNLRLTAKINKLFGRS